MGGRQEDPVAEMLASLGASRRGGFRSSPLPSAVHLKFGARNLLSAAVGYNTGPNPIIVVYTRESTESGPKWKYTWRSELIDGTADPEFETTMTFRPNDDMVELKVDVYDGDKVTKRRSQLPDSSRLIGSSVFKTYLVDLLSGRRFELPVELRSDPEWDVRLREVNAHVWLRQSNSACAGDPYAVPLSRSNGSLSFIVGARNLVKLSDYSSSDPTILVSARNRDTDTWEVLGRTELSVNNHDPIFERVFTVSGLTEVKLEVFLADSSRHPQGDLTSMPGERRLLGSGLVGLQDALASPDQEAEVLLVNRGDTDRNRAMGATRTSAWLRVVDGFENYDGPGDSIDLVIGARDLLKIGFLHKSDPLAALYLRTPKDRSYRYIGRTELIPNHHNPEFRKYFRLSGRTDLQSELRVDLYDGDSTRNASTESPLPDKVHLVGSSSFRLSELFARSGERVQHTMWHSEQFKSSALVSAGATVAMKAIDKRACLHTIQFNVGGRNMIRVPGHERTDPMVVLYCKENDSDRAPWKYVDRTRVLIDSTNPSFDEPLTMTMEQAGDPSLMLCVYHGSGLVIDETAEPPTDRLIGSTTVRLGRLLAESQATFRYDRGPNRSRAELQLSHPASPDMDRALATRGSMLWVSSNTARRGGPPTNYESEIKRLLLELTDRDPATLREREAAFTDDRLLRVLRRLLRSVEQSGTRAWKHMLPVGGAAQEIRPMAWVRDLLKKLASELNYGPRRQSTGRIVDILRATAAAANRNGRPDEVPLAGILNDVADDITRGNHSKQDLYDQPPGLSDRELQARMERAVDVAVDRRLTAGRDDFQRLNARVFDQYVAGNSAYAADEWMLRDRWGSDHKEQSSFVTYRLDVSCKRLATEYRNSRRAEPTVFLFRQDSVTRDWRYVSRTDVSRDNVSPQFRDSLIIDVDRDVDINPNLRLDVYDAFDHDVARQTIPDRARLIGTTCCRLGDLVDGKLNKRSMLHPDDPVQNTRLLQAGSQLQIRNGQLLDGLLKYATLSAGLQPHRDGLKLRVGLVHLQESQALLNAPVIVAVYLKRGYGAGFKFVGTTEGRREPSGICHMVAPVVLPWDRQDRDKQRFDRDRHLTGRDHLDGRDRLDQDRRNMPWGEAEVKLDAYTGALAHGSWLASVPSSSALLGSAVFSVQHVADRMGERCETNATHPDGIAHRDLRSAGVKIFLQATSNDSSVLMQPDQTPLRTVFRIRVGCRDLVDDIYREQGAGYTLVALYKRTDDNRYKFVDQTELSRNMQSPNFDSVLHLEHDSREDPTLMVVAYYQKHRGQGVLDRKSAVAIGSALLTMQELVEYPDRRVSRQLSRDGDTSLKRHLLAKGSSVWAQVESETERDQLSSSSSSRRASELDGLYYNDILDNGDHETSERIHRRRVPRGLLEVNLSARNVLLSYGPSTVAAVYKFDVCSGNWLYEGCTETIRDESSPRFARRLLIEHSDSATSLDAEYKVNLYDNLRVESSHLRSHNDFREMFGLDSAPPALPEEVEYIGSAHFRLGDVVPEERRFANQAGTKRTFKIKNNRNCQKNKRLIDDGSTVTIRTREVDGDGDGDGESDHPYSPSLNPRTNPRTGYFDVDSDNRGRDEEWAKARNRLARDEARSERRRERERELRGRDSFRDRDRDSVRMMGGSRSRYEGNSHTRRFDDLTDSRRW